MHFSKIFIYLLIAGVFGFPIQAQQTTETFTTPGSSTFTVPAGVTELTIEAWGAGGKGGNANKSQGSGNVASAGGGGGGAYATTTITVTPGDVIPYTVGAGATTTSPGGTSSATAGGSTVVTASGGNSAANATGNGQTTAGATGGSTGDFTGGNGANGNSTRSGGGGSSAGTASNGVNATTSTGATAPAGGGNGGNGTSGSANGTAGVIPGGGGGGARATGGGDVSRTGGNGANGQIRFTYDDGCNTLTSVSTAVTSVDTRFTEVPPVTAPSGFLFGVGTENKRNLVSFEAGTLDFAIDKLADRVVLRRAGTAGQVSGVDKDLLFFEKSPAYAANSGLTPKEFRTDYFPTMEQALVGVGINRGADNVFNNTTTPNNNNIERVDFIFTEGITVPADPSIGGFPVFERNGNDNFKLAVISALDTNQDPSEYNTVVSYTASDWTPTSFSINSSVLSRNGGNFTEAASLSSQDIEVIFVSFADMGLTAGDILYGYSLAGGDVTTDCVNFLDFTNTSFFPQNTDSASGNGGLDLMSGGSFSKKSFIYTTTGWTGDDPNSVTPGCDDNLTIFDGTAPINSNMTFGSLSALGGSMDLGSNTLSICSDINVESDFDISSGTVEMIGTTGTQNISGDSKLTVDELRLNNPDGARVNTDVDVSDVLYVDDGELASNGFISLPCFFTEPTSGNFQNGDAGQIGPIGVGGSISGDVKVEQCYPGRRAYRYVSASTTTTTSIQDNWQENATAYNNIPVSSTIQDDGIPYGFGTHITGLGYLPGHSSTGPGAVDQTDGLDWQPSGNPSMFEFDESTQFFNPVLATEPTPLVAGKAYSMIIRGSREVDLTSNASPTYNTKLRSTGTVEQGSVTINTTVNAVPTPTARQYVFVGNPFHAIVDMIDVFNNSTGLNQFVYAFDPTLGSNNSDTNDTSVLEGNRGAFVTIDLTSPPTSGMSNFLQVYQGVFMDAAVLSPSIVFNEGDKAVLEQQLDVFSTPTDRVTITLYDQDSYADNSTENDMTVINFDQNKSSSINFNDALKFTNPNENLGRLEGNSLLSIENRAMPEIGEVLELFTNNYRTTDYVFVVKVDGLLDNTVTLYDNYAGTETVLNNDASTAVSFTVDPANPVSEATDRFELRFETSTLGNNEFDLQGISVYPNPASDILNINLGDNTGRFESLELYDISGRLIAKKDLSNQVLDVQMNVDSYSPGVYVLKVSSGAEQFSTKVIIR